MFSQSIIVALLYATGVIAQLFPYPETGENICDGLIRPDWEQCLGEVRAQMSDRGVIVGPLMNEGTTFTASNCQVRAVRCSESNQDAYDSTAIATNIVQLIFNECGAAEAGGAGRQGDTCVIVETEDNPFPGGSSGAANKVARSVSGSAFTSRIAGKDHSPAHNVELEGRQGCTQECFEYDEGTFLTNIRGPAERVCDNVLPNEARCDQSRSVTISQAFTIGVEIGAGIEGVVSASASFSSEVGEEYTSTLNTAITVNCENGGYVVYYPYFQESVGRCIRGIDTACNSDSCFPEETVDCQFRKPILPGEGVLSGEYDVQCI